MDLLKLITNKDRLDYSENYNYKTDFLGTGLFTPRKTNNLKIAMARLMENGNLPVMAQFHAFDTEARIGDRTNYKEVEFEKLLIKEKLNQGERIAYYLNGVTDEDMIKDFIFDDMGNLTSRVLTRAELANMQVMATGKLTISENNFNTVVDYNLPDTNKLMVSGWNTASHDIIGDLNKIKAVAKGKGQAIDKALTSSKVIGYMLKNTAILGAYTNNNTTNILTEDRLLSWIYANFGIAFVTNDEVYKTSASSTDLNRFFPDDVISFFGGNGSFGEGLYTTTPSELFGEVERTNGFVALNTWKSTDPAGIWTKAEAVYLPVPKNIDGLFICSVTA